MSVPYAISAVTECYIMQTHGLHDCMPYPWWNYSFAAKLIPMNNWYVAEWAYFLTFYARLLGECAEHFSLFSVISIYLHIGRKLLCNQEQKYTQTTEYSTQDTRSIVPHLIIALPTTRWNVTYSVIIIR